MTDTWWEYVKKTSHKARPSDIAEQTHIPSPTISRWNPESKGGPARPEPDNVVRFARAYGRSPLEALISAGYIEADDIGRPIEPLGAMSDVSDSALIEELGGRLAEFRRLLSGQDTQDWPPPGWGTEDPGMGGMKNSNQGG